jgi:hypothetical protein
MLTVHSLFRKLPEAFTWHIVRSRDCIFGRYPPSLYRACSYASGLGVPVYIMVRIIASRSMYGGLLYALGVGRMAWQGGVPGLTEHHGAKANRNILGGRYIGVTAASWGKNNVDRQIGILPQRFIFSCVGW